MTCRQFHFHQKPLTEISLSINRSGRKNEKMKKYSIRRRICSHARNRKKEIDER